MSGLPSMNVVPIARDERPDGREWSDASAPGKRVYLDHGASTPCDPAVIALMERVMMHEFANPSSSHQAGRRAGRAVEVTRDQITDAIRADRLHRWRYREQQPDHPGCGCHGREAGSRNRST